MFALNFIGKGGGGSGPTTPTIDSVSNTQHQAIGCGINWILSVGWTVSAIDDATYSITIRDVLNNIVASGLGMGASPQLIDTGEVGDPLATGTDHFAQYTIQIIRISDSAVIDQETTTLLTVETGPSC